MLIRNNFWSSFEVENESHIILVKHWLQHLWCSPDISSHDLAWCPFGGLIPLVWEIYTIYCDKCCTKNAGTQKRCDINFGIRRGRPQRGGSLWAKLEGSNGMILGREERRPSVWREHQVQRWANVMFGELQLCVIEYQVSMQGGGSGDAMATGRGWLEPYIFCCGFILLLKISKMGHGTIISVFER